MKQFLSMLATVILVVVAGWQNPTVPYNPILTFVLYFTIYNSIELRELKKKIKND